MLTVAAANCINLNRLSFGFNKKNPPQVETIIVDDLFTRRHGKKEPGIDANRVWNALAGKKGIKDDSAPRFLILNDRASSKPGALGRFRRKVLSVMAGIARQYNANQLPPEFRTVLQPPFDFKLQQSSVVGPNVLYPSKIIAESYPDTGRLFKILNPRSRSSKFALQDFGGKPLKRGVYSPHLDSVRFPLLSLMYGGNENIDPTSGQLALADGRQLIRDKNLLSTPVPDLFVSKPQNSNDWARDYSYLKPVYRRDLPDYTVPIDNWIVEPDFNIAGPGSVGGDRLAVMLLNSHNPEHGLLFHAVPNEPKKLEPGQRQSIRRVTNFTLEHVEPRRVRLS